MYVYIYGFSYKGCDNILDSHYIFFFSICIIYVIKVQPFKTNVGINYGLPIHIIVFIYAMLGVLLISSHSK